MRRADVGAAHSDPIEADAVVIGAGPVGLFQVFELGVLGKFRGTQLFYSVKKPAELAGKHIVILGGGDSALDWGLNFAQDGPNKAASVTLVHRREGFKAAPASIAKMKQLCDSDRMRFLVGQVTSFEETDGRLSSVKVTGPDTSVHEIAADALLVFFGLSPRLGPIANWGLAIER